MSVEVSRVVWMDLQEQIRDLKQLVKDYDNYLQEIMPHVYTYYSKPAHLRERARQEGVNIKEPTP